MGYWLVIRGLVRDGVGEYDDPATFQLNVGGMERYKLAMLDIGMAYGPSKCPLPWPEPEAYGLDIWPDPYDPAPEVQRFIEAEKVHLGQVGDQPGIPLFKLSSNDSWWIRPAECSSALLLAERNPAAVARHLAARAQFRAWLEFLGRAVQHGGIVVG